jgi:hypothetical protein
MTKAEFDSWAVTMGAAIDSLDTAAPEDVAALSLALGLHAITFKVEYLQVQEPG